MRSPSPRASSISVLVDLIVTTRSGGASNVTLTPQLLRVSGPSAVGSGRRGGGGAAGEQGGSEGDDNETGFQRDLRRAAGTGCGAQHRGLPSSRGTSANRAIPSPGVRKEPTHRWACLPCAGDTLGQRRHFRTWLDYGSMSNLIQTARTKGCRCFERQAGAPVRRYRRFGVANGAFRTRWVHSMGNAETRDESRSGRRPQVTRAEATKCSDYEQKRHRVDQLAS